MNYLTCVVKSLGMTAKTLVLSPWLVAQARYSNGPIDNGTREAIEPRLPATLAKYSTSDNSLLGDAGHKLRWQGRPEYLQMLAWLWRNPAYVYETETLGAPIYPGDQILYVGNLNIKNRDAAVSGALLIQIDSVWCFKAVIRYGKSSRCCMLEFGWKLQEYAQYGLPTIPERAQLVFSVRPLTSFLP